MTFGPSKELYEAYKKGQSSTMSIPLPSITGGASGPAMGDARGGYNTVTFGGGGLKLPSWPQLLVVGLIVGSVYLGVKFIKK